MENCSNEDSLISENPLSSVSSTINQSSRWKKLRNVIKAVSLLRNQDAVINEDIEKLVTEIKKIPTDQEYRNDRDKRNESSPYTIALNDVRRHQRFLKAVERGTPEDLKIIKEELANDPYRFLRLSNHPLSLVNKRNNSEQTPLYVACKNANYDVAKLLLDSGADHLIASKTNGEAESCLEVAARWRHTRIIDLLLKEKKWQKCTIKNAIKESKNPKITKTLACRLKQIKHKTVCFCIRSGKHKKYLI